MDYQKCTLQEFIDRMGQDYKLYPWQRDILKLMAKSKKAVIHWPRQRFGRSIVMEKARHIKFWVALKSLVEHFNSSHPWDKSIVQELVKGGMTKEEVKQFRDLTLKAAKAYYGKH